MASLRNLAIGALRLTDQANIAAGLRHHTRGANRPLTVMMFMVTPLAGLTHPLTDVPTVLYRMCRPAGCHHARGRTGACDFIAPLCVKRPVRGAVGHTALLARGEIVLFHRIATEVLRPDVAPGETALLAPEDRPA